MRNPPHTDKHKRLYSWWVGKVVCLKKNKKREVIYIRVILFLTCINLKNRKIDKKQYKTLEPWGFAVRQIKDKFVLILDKLRNFLVMPKFQTNRQENSTTQYYQCFEPHSFLTNQRQFVTNFPKSLLEINLTLKLRFADISRYVKRHTMHIKSLCKTCDKLTKSTHNAVRSRVSANHICDKLLSRVQQ